MTAYIIRRLLYMIPTILVISLIAFIVIDLPPGDYLTSYIVQLESQGVEVTEGLVESLRHRYGLGRPLHVRYFRWIRNIITRGDFGMSFGYNRPARDLIRERIPMTMVVAFSTLFFTYVVAIPIGIYSAVKQYSIGDYLFTSLGFLGLSIPNFLLALVLMFLGYTYFDMSIGGLFSTEFRHAPWSLARFVDLLKHLIIPVIVVGTAGTASMIRIMRGVLLDELGKNYVNTARSKGVREFNVILKHAVRIAVNPLISQAAFQLPMIISGAAITAIVLSLPTTGPMLLEALQTQDMYLAGGLIFILSILTVIGTFLSDILLAWMDPRISYE